MNEIQAVWAKLEDHCAARGWRGFDPYDGLTSPVAYFLRTKLARQFWTQLHRRSPVNLRRLFGIAPQMNSTTIALAALGSGNAAWLDTLETLRTPQGGWGYPFPWQSRAFYAAADTANLICTALAVRAFRRFGRPYSVQFIENYLIRQRAGEHWIAYISGDDAQVHNVNMIGAALLGRADCMEFSVKRQRPDGSWFYGEAPNQRWIDNFHTGYNLVALRESRLFPAAAARGFAYWDQTFWTSDFAPRYLPGSDFPQDIHCAAQGILTYLAFGQTEKAQRVAAWAIANMWDPRGFFWYRRGRWRTNRIDYIRWSQAWMYYALANLIRAT